MVLFEVLITDIDGANEYEITGKWAKMGKSYSFVGQMNLKTRLGGVRLG